MENYTVFPWRKTLQSQYSLELPFAAVDIGGTRTKIGVHMNEEWIIEVIDTPQDWLTLTQEIQ